MENESPNNLQEYKNGVIAFIIIATLLIGYVYFTQSVLESSNTYTIGTVYYVSESVVFYSFYFKNKPFKGSSGLPSNVRVAKGGQYLLKISKDRLWVTEIQYGYPIPECIKKAPSEGWEGIPDFSKLCE